MSKTRRGCLVLVGIIIVSAVGCCWLPFAFMPGSGIGMALPVIYVPGEILARDFLIPGFNLTNTLVGTLLTDLVIIVLLVILYLRGGIKRVPGRLQGFLELLVNYFYNLAKSIAGARAARVFPLVMSIFFFLLIANWLKLIPGAESVGLMHCAAPGFSGYPRQIYEWPVLGEVQSLEVRRVSDDIRGLFNAGERATLADFCACEQQNVGHIPEEYVDRCAAIGFVVEEHAEGEAEAAAEGEVHEETQPAEGEAAVPAAEGEPADAGEGETAATAEGEPNPNLFVVTPFVRGATTDLNLTLALAVIAVVLVQIYGVSAQGFNYFQKFVNVDALGDLRRKPMGVMDFLVGLLEIVSEISRIISFTFRLFGNLFAGTVLLFIMSFLVATILPIIFYGLELFVGLIQAFVFAMLTLIFGAQAMAGHGGDEHHG